MGEIVVFVTAGSEEEAAAIARALVEDRLAACVNIIGNIRSFYWWEGKIEDDSEVLMIIKTTENLFETLQNKVEQMHSYSTAEIISFPISKGSEKYLKWLRDSVISKE